MSLSARSRGRSTRPLRKIPWRSREWRRPSHRCRRRPADSRKRASSRSSAADARIGGVGQVRGGGGGFAHLELHVRLPRRYPHIADENVVDHHGWRNAGIDRPSGHFGGNSFHCHFEWTTGSPGLQISVPASQGVGDHHFVLIAKGHADLFAGRGSSPHVHRQISLYHHVVGEDFGKRDLGGSERRCKQDRKKQQAPVQWRTPVKQGWLRKAFPLIGK